MSKYVRIPFYKLIFTLIIIREKLRKDWENEVIFTQGVQEEREREESAEGGVICEWDISLRFYVFYDHFDPFLLMLVNQSNQIEKISFSLSFPHFASVQSES